MSLRRECDRREGPIISAPGGPMDMGCLEVDYIGRGESESSKNGSFTGSFACVLRE